MWAFLLTALSTGAKIVVFRGSPLYPNVKFLPRLLSKLRFVHEAGFETSTKARCRVSVFGTSAKYLTDLMDSNAKPSELPTLSSRLINNCLTASPIRGRV